MIVCNFCPDGRRIQPADIDDTDKDIGMIAVYKNSLRKQLQLFQNKIQNMRTGIVSPVIVNQVKVINICHEKSVSFFLTLIVADGENFFFQRIGGNAFRENILLQRNHTVFLKLFLISFILIHLLVSHL